MNNYYVYFHRRKTNNKVFYVGKGKDHRAFSFKGRTEFWREIESKHGFVVDIVRSSLSNDVANELEMFYIKTIGLENLCNITIGGMGGDTISNHPNREEIIKKMANFGEKNPNFGGKLCTDEWRQTQITVQSKTPIQIIDTINGDVKIFRNSREAGESFNCSGGTIRTAKSKGILILDRYEVKNV